MPLSFIDSPFTTKRECESYLALPPAEAAIRLSEAESKSACAASSQVRARGCILGLMVGDALGASVEGWTPEDISTLAQERWGSPLIRDFIDAVHTWERM